VCACAEVIGALSRCCLGAEMFLRARAFIPRLSVQCLFQCACGRIEDKSCRSDVKRVLNNHLIIIHAHNEHTWTTSLTIEVVEPHRAPGRLSDHTHKHTHSSTYKNYLRSPSGSRRSCCVPRRPLPCSAMAPGAARAALRSRGASAAAVGPSRRPRRRRRCRRRRRRRSRRSRRAALGRSSETCPTG
jgi:hypothetical protein